MSTTEKRITLALTKEEARTLKVLGEALGENQSQTIKRAIMMLYYITFIREEK
jgi:hypothetical protein